MRKSILAICLVLAAVFLVGPSDSYAQGTRGLGKISYNEFFVPKITCIPDPVFLDDINFGKFGRYTMNLTIPLRGPDVINGGFYDLGPFLNKETQIEIINNTVLTNPEFAKFTFRNLAAGRKFGVEKKLFKYYDVAGQLITTKVVRDLWQYNWNKNNLILKLTGLTFPYHVDLIDPVANNPDTPEDETVLAETLPPYSPFDIDLFSDGPGTYPLDPFNFQYDMLIVITTKTPCLGLACLDDPNFDGVNRIVNTFEFTIAEVNDFVLTLGGKSTLVNGILVGCGGIEALDGRWSVYTKGAALLEGSCVTCLPPSNGTTE